MRLIWLAWLASVTVVGALILWCYSWYYDEYQWPKEIQLNLTGRVLVSSKFLINRTGSSHYGQGMYRWYYSIDRPSAALVQLCSVTDYTRCRFGLSHTTDNISRSIRFDGKVLTVEEVWL